ncbi:MAG TPA: PspC domain-containing protein, partial [Baekduia sp.]|nr:PspC domain-containing protein [Baekduia sp.]
MSAATAPGAPAHPPLRRDPAHGVVGGVCAGVARRLGVDPLVVRVIAVVVAVSTGIGFLAYALAWALMAADAGEQPSLAARLRTRPGAWLIATGVGCLALSALLTARAFGLWVGDPVAWPLVLAAGGAALVWRQSAGRTPAPAAVARPRDAA